MPVNAPGTQRTTNAMRDPLMSLEELLTVRRVVKRAVVEYLDANEWLELTSIAITHLAGSCETLSSLFALKYFELRAHLAQTAQFQFCPPIAPRFRSATGSEHSCE